MCCLVFVTVSVISMSMLIGNTSAFLNKLILILLLLHTIRTHYNCNMEKSCFYTAIIATWIFYFGILLVMLIPITLIKQAIYYFVSYMYILLWNGKINKEALNYLNRGFFPYFCYLSFQQNSANSLDEIEFKPPLECTFCSSYSFNISVKRGLEVLYHRKCDALMRTTVGEPRYFFPLTNLPNWKMSL